MKGFPYKEMPLERYGAGSLFTITAINGQRISSVFFSTIVAMVITNVDDVAQIRIGGVQGTQTTIPEPTSMLLLGTGLTGAAGAARRKLNTRT